MKRAKKVSVCATFKLKGVCTNAERDRRCSLGTHPAAMAKVKQEEVVKGGGKGQKQVEKGQKQVEHEKRMAQTMADTKAKEEAAFVPPAPIARAPVVTVIAAERGKVGEAKLNITCKRCD